MSRLIDADALIDWLNIVPLENGMINPDVVVECIRAMPDDCGGWISVKDRMPEKDKDVLVWLYGDYCIGRYDKDPDNLQMRWKFESFNLYEDDMSYITHWMPLPEPPKEENSGNEQHMP